ncbi:ATP-dependent DNA helicase RecG [Vicingaceae bacterium]|nr:ATP-dependent DNA helicase RecG [Vicingaceae bacterium]
MTGVMNSLWLRINALFDNALANTIDMPASEKTNPKPNKLDQADLLRPVQFVKGVGPQRAELLNRLGIQNAVDLLFFFPRRYQDFSTVADVNDFVEGELVGVEGTIDDIDQSTGGGRSAIYLLIRTGNSVVRAIWFNQPYLIQKLQHGQRVLLRGVPKQKLDRWEMVHPKISWLQPDENPGEGGILPIYSLTDGINQYQMRKLTGSIVDELASELDEVFPEQFLQEQDLAPISSAIRQIHFPSNLDNLEEARRRFVYQELLILQLALALRREQVRRTSAAPVLLINSRIKARILRRFPFELTPSQLVAVEEIAQDMAQPYPMNRLLHGDVGSGKTVVATFAMLLAIAHGFQTALMAPTEILARQHFLNLSEQLEGSRVKVALLTGSMSASSRRSTHESIAAGDIDIVVGTSAVVARDLSFHKLGLVVIDEQHKFGVKQRAQLRQSELDPHYLVMTATPIPRTVSMSIFGDLDLSTLEKEGETSTTVHTYLGEEEKRESWWEFFRKKLRQGRQGFVVTPLVDGDDHCLAGAEQMFEALANGPLEEFRIDLLHGRQTPTEKEAAMLSFARGRTQVLVATSVIEVGIDVPNATVMTIESGHRFGLSQLHQMRGRVSRGKHPGYVCVFADATNEQSRKRLEAFVNTNDGFELAEQDLRLRGPGDLFGTAQHGMPPLRISDLVRDTDILTLARDDARQLIGDDPMLADESFAKLRRMVIARYGQALDISDVG